MLTRGCINVKRERKVSQGDGRKKRGESMSIFTPLHTIRIHIAEIRTPVVDITPLVKFIDKSETIKVKLRR